MNKQDVVSETEGLIFNFLSEVFENKQCEDGFCLGCGFCADMEEEKKRRVLMGEHDYGCAKVEFKRIIDIADCYDALHTTKEECLASWGEVPSLDLIGESWGVSRPVETTVFIPLEKEHMRGIEGMLYAGSGYGLKSIGELDNYVKGVLENHFHLTPERPVNIVYNWYTREGRLSFDSIMFTKTTIQEQLLNQGFLKSDRVRDVKSCKDVFHIDPHRRGVEIVIKEVVATDALGVHREYVAKEREKLEEFFMICKAEWAKNRRARQGIVM